MPQLPAFPTGPIRFFALDVETANSDVGSICQLGVACVLDSGAILTWGCHVDPGTERFSNSWLHGITARHCLGAPRIGAVIDHLNPHLSGRTVYQHSSFDQRAIRAASAALGRSEPDWGWQDSVKVARAAWPELKGNGGHGLGNLKKVLGLNFEHHDAIEDARAAAMVVLMAAQA
ncbi:exonuclease domain-containing protein [Salipiger sp. 1_MG-2023]|uniref:exonuclease domain-containing protein n=1 Tax=Salipiger sp. 1_MG-2023 TaxID=3062665 RepID=UPI0026E2FFFB|nr:exonuclease domain-containing protein [Salipiger sp. 1_MG-2023]MDO6587554.1 exonuclease domain-containing protein [Salipiger sp. 1_MG-2023]